MHTVSQIQLVDFEYMLDEQAVSFDDVFPHFHPGDRVGIVVKQSSGAIGASALLMASIAKFYDFYRKTLGNKPGKVRIYPDFYIFHVGRRAMDHYWLDIWPPNKEVDVIDDSEQILEAINDRGITRLIIPDGPMSQIKELYGPPKEESFESGFATYLKETVSSAEQRIVSCIIYSPNGRTKESDLMIRSSLETEQNVFNCIINSGNISDALRNEMEKERKELLDEGRAIETYRRSTLTEAISMLSTSTTMSDTTKKYIASM